MSRPETRRARLAIAWGALVVGAALVLAQVAGVTGGDEELDYEWTSAGLLLSNDGAGSALFSAAGLAPGDSRTNCVNVTYDDTETAVLRLHGTVAGAAADAVDLTVEVGSGGSYGDCTGFTGTPSYAGTLAGFAVSHADFATGIAVPAVAPGTPVSFRFTVTVRDDNTAQGQSANATFTWEAESIPAPTTTTTAPPTTTTAPPETTTTTAAPITVPTLPPVTVPTIPELPVTVPTLPPLTVPTVPDVDESTRRVTPRVAQAPVDAEPTTTSSTTTSTTAPAAPTDPPATEQLRPTEPAAPPAEPGPTGLAAALAVLIEVAAVAAKESSFPGSLLLVIALFLIAQDRIDRKDPKLALAPTHRESALGFSNDGGEQ